MLGYENTVRQEIAMNVIVADATADYYYRHYIIFFGGNSMFKRQPAVYIMTNKCNGTLYTGVTRNLVGRHSQHKNKENIGFTEKYNCKRLVYYEEYELAIDAIQREKNIKKWKREWKIKMIEKLNIEWKDLSINFYD